MGTAVTVGARKESLRHRTQPTPLRRAAFRSVGQCYGWFVLRRLWQIGCWLAANVKEKKLPFSVRVTAEREPNALALPGGPVFVSRPLLEMCQGQRDEIAFMVAHEMAHIVQAAHPRSHPRRRRSFSFAGSEIEAVFVESLYQAFGEDKEPTDLAIAEALTDFVPLQSDLRTAKTGWNKSFRSFFTSSKRTDEAGVWARFDPGHQPHPGENQMKNQIIVKKLTWLLATCFVSALALSACRHTGEHPQGEHPKKEHPATNAPPRNP